MTNNYQPTDSVGDYARKLLSWYDLLKATQLNSSDTDNWTTRCKIMMVNSIQAELKDAALSASKLQEKLKNRESVNAGKRETEYFEEIFRCKCIPDPPEVYATVPDLGLVEEVVTRINELYTLKRFFKCPSEWKEARIFELENKYANSLHYNVDYMSGIVALENEFGTECLLNTIRADFSELSRYEDEFSDTSEELLPVDQTINDAPYPIASTKFIYKFAAFCERFDISGIDNKEPVIQLFSIYRDHNSIHVEIPLYLSLDMSRNFPSDVVKVLTKRSVRSNSIFPKANIDPSFGCDLHADLWLIFVYATAKSKKIDSEAIYKKIFQCTDIASEITTATN